MIACAAGLALAVAAAQGRVHKWVDAKGRTHDGEKPRERGKSEPCAD